MDIAIKGAKAPNLSIYFFDIAQDYPAIGGVAEFSSTLFAHLKQRYGARVISARTAATGLNIPDAGSMPYLHRERLVAQRLADRDPHSVFVFPNFQSPVCRRSGVTAPASSPSPTPCQPAHW